MSGAEARTTLPLFVYGTLRKGKCNHHYLHGKYDRMLTATLPGYLRVHPIMVKPHPGAAVEGELYFIKPELFHAVLQGCDHLEELYPGELHGPDYRRLDVLVTTAEGERRAWAYVNKDAPTPEDSIFRASLG
ncbi:MAG: gamma-glutamylcyclotransferase [Planctomycetaceae bacterium]